MITRVLISFMIYIISFAAFAENQTACMSHGDCQAVYGTQTGTKCYIVKTGVNHVGKITCALRCYVAELGSSCEKEETSSIFGLCKQENFEMPVFNPTDPNKCQSAIDPF